MMTDGETKWRGPAPTTKPLEANPPLTKPPARTWGVWNARRERNARRETTYFFIVVPPLAGKERLNRAIQACQESVRICTALHQWLSPTSLRRWIAMLPERTTIACHHGHLPAFWRRRVHHLHHNPENSSS